MNNVELNTLIQNLHNIESITSKEGDWFNNLSIRKKAESEFHDKMRDYNTVGNVGEDTYEEIYTNKKFYRTNELSKKYFDNWMKNSIKDKIVLDYACGDGKQAIIAAQLGAKLVIGIDVSKKSIENAKTNAKNADVEHNTYFLQGDCENTLLPDSCIDIVLCAGVLHHLDLSYAFPELRRILAPGGKIFSLEALDYNPLIKLYRTITPNLRTEWEKSHILSLKDLNFSKKFFNVKEIKYWHLMSILGVYFPKFLSIFNFIDNVLTKIPYIQRLAWIFTFELESQKSLSKT